MSTKVAVMSDITRATIAGIGKRLKEERRRLGLKQDVFAEIGGVRRATQYLYEQGDRMPSMEYLLRVVAAGADVGFLVFGKEHGYAGPLSFDKSDLSKIYRLVDELGRDTQGRLFDLEYRMALFESLCVAAANRPPEEINWEDLLNSVKREKITG